MRTIQEWARRYPLIAAFSLSLLIHSALYGGWRVGHLFGWWDHQATWLLNLKTRKATPSDVAEAVKKKLEERQKVIPLTFVEVPSAAATAEPPKETKFYGALNSKAANPDPAPQEKEQAKADGAQDKVIRLVDNPLPKPKSFPLQPSLPPEEIQPPEPEPEKTTAQTEEPAPAGDQAKSKPVEVPLPTDAIARIVTAPPPEPKKERPRTLAAARAQDPSLAGTKYKQEGGVRRRGSLSLDVKASPFGAYDLAFIRAVEARWFSLLDSTSFVQRSGKVVVEFKLNVDGRITNLSATENEVGEVLGLICERAILDPAPYASWPSDMRRMVGDTYRDIKFTFYYH